MVGSVGLSRAHLHGLGAFPRPKPSYRDKEKLRVDETSADDGFELDKRAKKNLKRNAQRNKKNIEEKNNKDKSIDVH